MSVQPEFLDDPNVDGVEIQEPAFVSTEVPHSKEAEEAVVGGILIDPDQIVDVFDVLQSPDFYIHRLRWVYELLVELFTEGMPIDLLTVAERLNVKGCLEEIG